MPLVYTQALPTLSFDRLLVPTIPVPEPPVVDVTQPEPATAAATVHAPQPRVFEYARLQSVAAPTRVPSTNPMDFSEVAPAPGIRITATGSDSLVPTGGLALPGVPTGPPAPIPPRTTTPEPDLPAGPVMISSSLQAAKLIRRIDPAYSQMARQLRLSGKVELHAIIARDGHIRELRAVSGHPILAKLALDAVAQWIYSPTVLSGQPVEIETVIEVNFALR